MALLPPLRLRLKEAQMPFPRPPINDVKQDDTTLHYTRGGDFSKTDIGARASGMPGGMGDDQMTMGIRHVGDKFGPKGS